MDVAVKKLVQRKGSYYFRCRLPDYGGEIKISLKTQNLKKAVDGCKFATDRLNSILAGAWKMIPIQQIRKLIADSLIPESLEDWESLTASLGRLCPATLKDGADDMLTLSNYIENALRENDLSAMSATASAEELLKDTTHDELDVLKTAKEFLRA